MTASEFAFLALGLVLGVASGAALVEVLRPGPPPPRGPGHGRPELDPAPRDHARRSRDGRRGPARGGPADRREMDRDMPPDDDLDSTRQASAVDPVAPVVGDVRVGRRLGGRDRPGSNARSIRCLVRGPRRAVSADDRGGPGRRRDGRRGEPRSGRHHDLPRTRPDGGGAPGDRRRRPPPRRCIATGPATEPAPGRECGRGRGGVRWRRRAGRRRGRGRGTRARRCRCRVSLPTTDPASRRPTTRAPTCGGSPTSAARSRPVPGRARPRPRRRCGRAQRAYDDLLSSAEAAAATADPRSVRAAKEAAQLRSATRAPAGRTRDDVETAARDWLTEINASTSRRGTRRRRPRSTSGPPRTSPATSSGSRSRPTPPGSRRSPPTRPASRPARPSRPARRPARHRGHAARHRLSSPAARPTTPPSSSRTRIAPRRWARGRARTPRSSGSCAATARR